MGFGGGVRSVPCSHLGTQAPSICGSDLLYIHGILPTYPGKWVTLKTYLLFITWLYGNTHTTSVHILLVRNSHMAHEGTEEAGEWVCQ